MKLLVVCLLLTGCSQYQQAKSESNGVKICQDICQKKFGTDVDWVGSVFGNCFCK